MKCQFCKKELSKRKRKDSKFCNAQCMADYTKQKIIQAWTSDFTTANTKSGLSKTIRDHLLEKSNFSCEICGFKGFNVKTGKTILEVDHIDGNCYNNSPSNLRVLCPNCHAMSPNYKALNKNSGRKYRKVV